MAPGFPAHASVLRYRSNSDCLHHDADVSRMRAQQLGKSCNTYLAIGTCGIVDTRSPPPLRAHPALFIPLEPILTSWRAECLAPPLRPLPSFHSRLPPARVLVAQQKKNAAPTTLFPGTLPRGQKRQATAWGHRCPCSCRQVHRPEGQACRRGYRGARTGSARDHPTVSSLVLAAASRCGSCRG